MEDIDDGGSAFGEFMQAGQNAVKKGGLTIRDYFAAKAMQSILSELLSEGGASEPEDSGPIAKAAYYMADAMLAERKNNKEIIS